MAQKNKLSPRKLLVASVGVATVSYVGLSAIACDSNSTVANLVAPPPTVANLVAPPPLDAGAGDAQGLTDDAATDGSDSAT